MPMLIIVHGLFLQIADNGFNSINKRNKNKLSADKKIKFNITVN